MNPVERWWLRVHIGIIIVGVTTLAGSLLHWPAWATLPSTALAIAILPWERGQRGR